MPCSPELGMKLMATSAFADQLTKLRHKKAEDSKAQEKEVEVPSPEVQNLDLLSVEITFVISLTQSFGRTKILA